MATIYKSQNIDFGVLHDRYHNDSIYKDLQEENILKEKPSTVVENIESGETNPYYYGDPQAYYDCEAKVFMTPWTNSLLALRNCLQKKSGVVFNSVQVYDKGMIDSIDSDRNYPVVLIPFSHKLILTVEKNTKYTIRRGSYALIQPYQEGTISLKYDGIILMFCKQDEIEEEVTEVRSKRRRRRSRWV